MYLYHDLAAHSCPYECVCDRLTILFIGVVAEIVYRGR